MTSLAGYASAQAAEKRAPVPWIAALLSALTPGLGHLYIGQPRRGILLFALIVVGDVLLMFALMGVLARFWMFAVCLSLLFGLWLFIVVDAYKRAQRTPYHRRQGWRVYAAACGVAVVIAAIPCIYAVHAKSSGQLGYFHATAPSMEPTLKKGEFFLADATYYRSHAPSRGEVAVYEHPKQSRVHNVRRIVAVEGDRIAVRGGRAVVNGMALEEPYAYVVDPNVAINNMAETRVPAGHVFVLCDNRDERRDGSDSRDALTHGPVPVENLIGRVTDIAFSRVVGRMGRWIGTPSM